MKNRPEFNPLAGCIIGGLVFAALIALIIFAATL